MKLTPKNLMETWLKSDKKRPLIAPRTYPEHEARQRLAEASKRVLEEHRETLLALKSR